MHIIAGLVALIGIAAFVIYRIQSTSRAASTAVDMADDVRAAFRRFGFANKAQANPLDTVDDPRAAGAGVLVALAAMDGDLSRAQLEKVESECRRLFECSEQDATDLTAIGRWLTQQRGADEAVRRLSRHLASRLDAAEGEAFLDAAEAVSQVEGGTMGDSQQLAVAQLRKILA